ncbi:MAG: KEOPS complex subunit Pcc1 [Candidatus Methanomethylophilaceae archaeon]
MMELEIDLTYKDSRTADTVYRALEPDNKGYVESVLSEGTITFRIKANDAGSMKNSADDLLACMKIAEEASGLVLGSTADLDGDSLSE